jgi:DNA helicase HerA-like ATPase
MSAPANFEAPQSVDLDDGSIGRIVSVTGSKAIVLLDEALDARFLQIEDRPEMGTLLAIHQTNTTVLAIVSALSVPVPAQGEGDSEIWIAELGLVGELRRDTQKGRISFNRGVTVYPSLGDRVCVASTKELEAAFCGDPEGSVRIGGIRQDSAIPAMVRVDDLLGKHFAVLGTTGTGKSCTTALILRSILQKNPNAHIVLLDPHNEYATSFKEWGEILSPRNMQLPYWLLTFEELVEVLIGGSDGRKAEIEILQELIPIAKGRYGSGRGKDAQGGLRRGLDSARFTVDTPVPYRMSDLTAMIDERMGRLENKRDLHPYRQLKQRIDMVSQDARYAFMFGQLTVYDGMAQILGRIFRVPVAGKPITILELTGLPMEIVNVVVSVICRMTFDFALWSEGQIPVTIVCEEAHRYVPANSKTGFEPCKRAIAKIAKEGRTYGASLCLVTQRPAEIDPTILSQCNTVFALRMSNDRDQQIVQSAVSETGSGLLEFLPALGQREAIAFGDGVTLPVRMRFDELPIDALPRSSTARFSEKWQSSVGDDDFLERVVERWRASGADSGDDDSASMMAEAMNFGEKSQPAPAPQPAATAKRRPQQGGAAMLRQGANGEHPAAAANRSAVRRPGAQEAADGGEAARAELRRRRPEEAVAARENGADPEAADTVSALRSIRERLMQRAR